MDFNELIRNITLYIIPVILGITLHEAAHAYAARWMGDDTAERLGRISLNPLRHIDPVGTLVLPLLLLVLTKGAFTFGYAKPVPVNYTRMRRMNIDGDWLGGDLWFIHQFVRWRRVFCVDEPRRYSDQFSAICV